MPSDLISPEGDSLRRYPAFIQYWLSNVCSVFGFQMLSVAVGWQIYDITGSAFKLGLIGLVQFLPALLLTLPAGHYADQFDRRSIVQRTQALQMLATAVLAVLTLSGQIHELAILATVFAIGAGKAFDNPARKSMLPALLPAALLPRALALYSSGGKAATIMGPALGGFLYLAGPGMVYATAALLYLMAVILTARMHYQQAKSKREPATLKTVFAGVGFIRQRPDVLGVISLDLFAVLLGGVTTLLPIFAKDILQTGPWGLGLLRAAPAAGALLMSLWLAHYEMRRNIGMIMFGSVAGFGVGTLVFALSVNLWLSLAALAVLGAFDTISAVIRNSLVQLETPDGMRGRVNAVNSIFINSSNQLGGFQSGLMAAWLGAVNAAVFGGVGTLVVVGLWMAMFPTLRRRQRFQSDVTP